MTRRDALEATGFNLILVGLAMGAIHHLPVVVVALAAVAFVWMGTLVWRVGR